VVRSPARAPRSGGGEPPQLGILAEGRVWITGWQVADVRHRRAPVDAHGAAFARRQPRRRSRGCLDRVAPIAQGRSTAPSRRGNARPRSASIATRSGRRKLCRSLTARACQRRARAPRLIRTCASARVRRLGVHHSRLGTHDHSWPSAQAGAACLDPARRRLLHVRLAQRLTSREHQQRAQAPSASGGEETGTGSHSSRGPAVEDAAANGCLSLFPQPAHGYSTSRPSMNTDSSSLSRSAAALGATIEHAARSGAHRPGGGLATL
jgi:hypothetical protein